MDPWPRGPVGGLEGPDFVVALQRQCDFIEALQQAFAPPGVDVETDLFSRRRDNRLRLEIDADWSCALREFDFGGEAIDDRLIHDDRQYAVLKAVGEEDVAEA